jgi:hypothetical protein
MTITIWPHGWSPHAFLLLVAVFWFAATAGAAAGTWNLHDAGARFPGRAYCAPGTAHAPAWGLQRQLAGQYFPPCAIYHPVHGGAGA